MSFFLYPGNKRLFMSAHPFIERKGHPGFATHVDNVTKTSQDKDIDD